MPFGENYNIVWLAGVIGAALIGLLGIVIRRVSVPKNPAYVEKCIQQLNSIRQTLRTQRPQVFNPNTGDLLVEPPQSTSQLFDLLKYLMARDDHNQEIFRIIRHVLYPSKRGRVLRALKSSQSARKRILKHFQSAKEKIDVDRFSKADFERMLQEILDAADKFVIFEKEMVRAVDESLDCWADRIG
ncbi:MULTISPECIES: hypothetical protein [Oceanicaulis]|uniref:hypothetical protein n=1 Tax=Oceanicaulis TaxID=153232 RepID=UPI0012F0ADA5|nr:MULTISPECIES: hypothetical protein [Oceanicaulis]VXC92127.1 conserved hypothetical protein [Oceanicaulis sp. 350]|tara:strand:- start:565 stop:1122 length:558 start_codon:yes stop_codon:yes gene_type:complete